jgi:hypothetical protein
LAQAYCYEYDDELTGSLKRGDFFSLWPDCSLTYERKDRIPEAVIIRPVVYSTVFFQLYVFITLNQVRWSWIIKLWGFGVVTSSLYLNIRLGSVERNKPSKVV